MQKSSAECSRPESSNDVKSSRGLALALGALLAIAVCVNLVQFEQIQAKAGPEFKAFATWRGDILNASRKLSFVSMRYDAAFALAKFAPGASLILPKGHEFPTNEFKAQMFQWGGVKEIQYLKYDPDKFLAKVDVRKSVIARTRGSVRKYDRRRFVLIGDRDKKRARKLKGSLKEFIVLRRGSTDLLLDTSLVAKDIRGLKR